jgi:hypothetical protein
MSHYSTRLEFSWCNASLWSWLAAGVSVLQYNPMLELETDAQLAE